MQLLLYFNISIFLISSLLFSHPFCLSSSDAKKRGLVTYQLGQSAHSRAKDDDDRKNSRALASMDIQSKADVWPRRYAAKIDACMLF